MKFDNGKNAQNLSKHGVSFEDVIYFEWEDSITTPDERFDYGENRSISYGMAKGRLHILVWTMRGGEIRPISFRKANKRERDFYEEKKNDT